MKPMRLKAVLRETWRNVATGTSRCALISLLLSICAVACMCADLTQMTGLIGDARKWEESGASTYAITLQGGIDGAACVPRTECWAPPPSGSRPTACASRHCPRPRFRHTRQAHMSRRYSRRQGYGRTIPV